MEECPVLGGEGLLLEGFFRQRSGSDLRGWENPKGLHAP